MARYSQLQSTDKAKLSKSLPDLYRFFREAKTHNDRAEPGARNDDLIAATDSLFGIVKSVAAGTDTNTYGGFGGAIDAIDKELGGRPYSQISKERSEYMDASAAMDDKVGVWKIGDKHAGHLAGRQNRPYEVLTRSDFNNEYFKERQ